MPAIVHGVLPPFVQPWVALAPCNQPPQVLLPCPVCTPSPGSATHLQSCRQHLRLNPRESLLQVALRLGGRAQERQRLGAAWLCVEGGVR